MATQTDDFLDDLDALQQEIEEEDDESSTKSETEAKAITVKVMEEQEWPKFDFTEIDKVLMNCEMADEFCAAVTKWYKGSPEKKLHLRMAHYGIRKFLAEKTYKVGRKKRAERPEVKLSNQLKRLQARRQRVEDEFAELKKKGEELSLKLSEEVTRQKESRAAKMAAARRED